MGKYSQHHEDVILNNIFKVIGLTKDDVCIEIGAMPDFKNSNIRKLQEDYGCECFYVDIDNRGDTRIIEKNATAENINTVVYNTVFGDKEVFGVNEISCLSLDIDGNDYWVLRELQHEPRVIVAEYNKSITDNATGYVMPNNPEHAWIGGSTFYGANIYAIAELMMRKGYYLYAKNEVNLFFIYIGVMAKNAKELGVDWNRILEVGTPYDDYAKRGILENTSTLPKGEWRQHTWEIVELGLFKPSK